MRIRIVAVVAGLAICIAGCGQFPPGSLAPLPVSQGDRRLHVYLVRGFSDWYSGGVETLTATLCRDGFDARSFAEAQWEPLGDALAAGKLPRGRLVLIGFSYGADDVVSISRRLRDEGISVPLLITIDPVTPGAVPPNAGRCVDFYQSNGFWDLFPWLRGIPLHRERGDRRPLVNLNLRTHPELLEPNTGHATIAANPKVHAAIVQLVKAAAAH